MANIIYSPWERTKGPWLCLMTTLLFFRLLCFPLFQYFSLLWLNFLTVVFHRQKTGRVLGDWGAGGGGKGHMVLLHFIGVWRLLASHTGGDKGRNITTGEVTRLKHGHCHWLTYLAVDTPVVKHYKVFTILWSEALGYAHFWDHRLWFEYSRWHTDWSVYPPVVTWTTL